MNVDIAIVGAGPAGLCLARSLAGSGLAVALIEAQEAASLAEPGFDGREIALTHHSVHLLRELGIWDRIPGHEIHVLRDALVMNGSRESGMWLAHGDGHRPQLGFLVSNQMIRKAAFAAVAGQEGLVMLCGQPVRSLEPGPERSRVCLADGQVLTARLVVAADSRFSVMRRAMGIPADSHDFGKSMLVCRMRHEKPHGQVAWEWFGHGQTLARLPLSEHESSLVLTLPQTVMRDLVAAPEAAFATAMEARCGHRLGRMELISTRHVYPLVAVYARRFTAPRFALVGDAAVGMHPVTAHGFNLGLLGQDLLAGVVRQARDHRQDIGDATLLRQYGRELRRATRPLYLATGAIVRLYTDDTAPVRALRGVVLSAGTRLPAVRRALVHSVTHEGSSRAATYPLLGMLRALLP